jgi:SAM-dependent methyltransferase
VEAADAVELIRSAVPPRAGVWADLGAGDGTFTRALVEILEPGSRIYAVDRDRRALAGLARWAAGNAVGVVTVEGDFAGPFELPGLGDALLDGMLLANALHYFREPGPVLARLASRVRPGGRLVIVEYDRRRANPWVPHPIPSAQLPELVSSAGFSTPVVTATRPSEFGGSLYVAASDRLADVSRSRM